MILGLHSGTPSSFEKKKLECVSPSRQLSIPMALGNHDKRAHAVGVAITQISLSDTVCVLPWTSKADHLSSPLFLYVLVNNMEPVISASYYHTHFGNLCRSSAVETVCASKSSSNGTSSTCEPDLSQSYLSTTIASPICNPPEHLPAQPTSELLLFPFEVFRAPFMIYYYSYPDAEGTSARRDT